MRKVNRDCIESVLALRSSGKSIRTIEALTGLSRGTVYRIINGRADPLPPPPPHGNGYVTPISRLPINARLVTILEEQAIVWVEQLEQMADDEIKSIMSFGLSSVTYVMDAIREYREYQSRPVWCSFPTEPERSIARLLEQGHDPAAVSTIARCRFALVVSVRHQVAIERDRLPWERFDDEVVLAMVTERQKTLREHRLYSVPNPQRYIPRVHQVTVR